MELELKKECLDVFEAGDRQTLTQEETAETIVPDYCPDIARIISAEEIGRAQRCADVGICNAIFRAGKRYG